MDAGRDYQDQRAEAELRIASRDPDDWRTLALALTLAVPIWSQDKDFSDMGVEVVTTGALLDTMRAAGHPET
jgi:predicted nucleic acid-binding protein